MIIYILKRIAYLFVVVLGASTIVFILVRVIPGDPAQLMAGENAGVDELKEIRSELGIDKPLLEQYAIWIWGLMQGNFGKSFRNNELIILELSARAPATIELAVTSLIIGVPLGLLLGATAAIHNRTWIDSFSMMISVAGIAIPVFWIGLLLIMIFSISLDWTPLEGRVSASTALAGPTGFLIIDAVLNKNPSLLYDGLKHLILPAITLSLFPLSTVSRVTRSSMLEVLKQDYIRAARCKGLSWRGVIFKHALRNTLIPIVTVIGLSFGPLVGGAVLTETVFGWPGLGRYMVQVIYARDFPAIQAIIFLSALVFSTINLIVDLTYVLIDPRIRFG